MGWVGPLTIQAGPRLITLLQRALQRSHSVHYQAWGCPLGPGLPGPSQLQSCT